MVAGIAPGWARSARSTWAAYGTPGAQDIVCTVDAQRGIDILRIEDGGLDPDAETVTAPVPTSWFGKPGTASAPRGFTASAEWGWSCPLPETPRTAAPLAPLPG